MSEFDMDSAVSDVAAGLGLGIEPEDKNPKSPVAEVIVDPVKEPVAAKPAPAKEVIDPKVIDPKAAKPVDPTKVDPVVPVTRAAPKSWAADKAEIWKTLPPEAQDQIEHRERQMLEGIEQYKEHNAFGKSLKDVFTPYRAQLHAQGLDEVKATQYLLNAHYRLTQGSPEQRMAALRYLGESMGIIAAGEQREVDPALRELQDRQARTEAALNQENERRFNEARTRVSSEVESFAKDAPYFDEVSEDIVNLIHAAHARGENPDLKSIYDKAVWANPVTRAKELARTQQESEKALREKSAQEAEAARKASSANVRSRDTRRPPTEPLGTMDDTMRDTLKTIRNRAH